MVYKISEMTEVNVPVSRLRSITAQCVASSASSLLLFDLGLAVNFVTIALPHLLNAKEGLSLDDNQASWFGSLPFLSQPLGALASGPVVDYFGRKKATFLVNIPHVIAWILMYFSWNLPSLFMANALLGLGTGIMEAPLSAYVSEISEPSIRGALYMGTLLFLSLGMSAVYLLGALVTWRVAALICLSVPILTMILATLVCPDTPIWLLSQGREKDALKALCYLRGWTTPENVRPEFDELVNNSKNLDSCVICSEETKDCDEVVELNEIENECKHNKINVIKRFFIKFNIVMLCKETLRPLVFSLMYFMFYVMSGLYPIKPYMVNVCGAMGMADDTNTITVTVGVLTFVGTIIVSGGIKYFGKRKLGITGMLACAICCTVLSIHAGTHLDNQVFSYNPETYPKAKSVVPLVAFYGLALFTSINVSWILLGEVFPFRSRATSQGIAAAWNYIIIFIGSKTLIDIEKNFKLTGAFAIYAAFGFIGTAYLYLYMPETEGKTLHEIEEFYKGEHRIFADDWFINRLRKSKKEK